MATPIVELESGDKAVIIRRDVPEPVSHQGRNLIELDFRSDTVTDDDFFTPEAFEVPEPPSGGVTPPIGTLDLPAIENEVVLALSTGFLNRTLFPAAASSDIVLRLESAEQPAAEGTAPARPLAEPVNPAGIARAIKEGQQLAAIKLVDGSVAYLLTDGPPVEPEPHLYIVETYRLSTHLGDYGAGRVVKTFSLLPGEQTRISVRSFRRSEALRKQSSSILDSVTSESAKEFQKEIGSEQSNKQAYEKTFSYHAEAQASASWGWGSAKVSGGVKGSTNAAREEFSKNTARATEQHSAKASAKREVEINTSTEVTEVAKEEQSIEREVRNINVSRTLNFIFRQMNQELFTILHLIDVRVAFFNGHPGTRVEVPLYEQQSLLDQFVQPNHHASVQQAIQDSLETIMDHKGDIVNNFVEQRTLPDSDPYLRVNTDLVSTFTDPIGGASFRVPGIIVAVTRNVMRTEGVIVESILGGANALDSYAIRLQELEVERREAEVAYDAQKAKRAKLANEFASDGDEAKAKILADLCEACNDADCRCKKDDGE